MVLNSSLNYFMLSSCLTFPLTKIECVKMISVRLKKYFKALGIEANQNRLVNARNILALCSICYCFAGTTTFSLVARANFVELNNSFLVATSMLFTYLHYFQIF